MAKKDRHCKAVTAVPGVAVTGVELKLQYLGDFIVSVENMIRSAPWGIAYPKDFSGGS